MANIATISVQLRANTSGFSKGIKKSQQDAKGFSTTIKVASKAMSAFGSAIKFAGANQGLGLLIRGFGQLRAVAGRGLSAVTGMIGNSIESIDALGKASVKLGVSTKALARLQHAAKMAGVEQDTLTESMGKLQKSIAEAASDPKSKMASAFSLLGLDPTQLANQGIDSSLRQIVEGFDGVSNATERAAITFQLFGRGGQDFIPLLVGGAAALDLAAKNADRFGLSVSDIDSVTVEMAKDAWDRLKESLAGAANTIAIELSPYLTEVSNWLTDFVTDIFADGPTIREMFDGWGDSIAGVSKWLADVIRKLAKISDTVTGSGDNENTDGFFNRLGTGLASYAGEALEDAGYLLKDMGVGPFKDLSGTIARGLGRATQSLAQSSVPAVSAGGGRWSGGGGGILNSAADTLESFGNVWSIDDNERNALAEIAALTAGQRDEERSFADAFRGLTIAKEMKPEKEMEKEAIREAVQYSLTPALLRGSVEAINTANRRTLPNSPDDKKIGLLTKIDGGIKKMADGIAKLQPVDVAF